MLSIGQGPGQEKNRGPDQGYRRMCARGLLCDALLMSRYLLEHRHTPEECGVVFASFKGHQSPLRHRMTTASCMSGGHAIWWTVDAGSAEEALRLLPIYVAERTTVTPVSEVAIP